jgi:hypothetical protein
MSDRPTPEQIFYDYPASFLSRLRQHGYVIVHPDDVPDVLGVVPRYPNRQEAWRQGWDDCRRHIFGENR